ncbi:type II toxin-antitoxin system death-on-curing family toxin [bacterium]|nr:type II toxin-antitoxin system death-on-curing family toxin [bacterium]
MEKACRFVRYLSREEIIEINISQIFSHGGLLNAAGRIRTPNSFEYLLSQVQNDQYFPTLSEKAALYPCKIIQNHIFYDGNKRTGMTCLLFFLALNGRNLYTKLSEDETVELPLKIANNEFDLADVSGWIEEKLTNRPF